MKIKKQDSTLITSEDNSPSLNFGIGDTGVIIDILRRRLYSHPLRTMIQEYICNGRDATREAGSSENLVVVFPTKLDPVFKVRDFGPGLSPERVRDVFVLYGASTKRSDNTQTGGFGIGAKSAWAYTDSFTITSFYGGKKSTYIAHLGKNSEGSLDLLDEEATTEPNGVEIAVSIQEKDIESAISSIYRCCYFWDKRPTFKGIVSIEIPDWFTKNHPVSGEGFSVDKERLPFLVPGESSEKRIKKPLKARTSNSQNFWAVIDGIPYEVTKALKAPQREKLASTYQFYLYFSTGELQINANREEIVFDPAAYKTIQSSAEKMISSLIEQGQNKLKECKDLLELHEVTSKKNILFTSIYQDLNMTLDMKGSKLNLRYYSGSFNFDVADDRILDLTGRNRIRQWAFGDFGAVLPLKEDVDLNAWSGFLRHSALTFTTSFTKDLVLLRSQNPDFYEPFILGKANQEKLRKMYQDYLESEKKAKKEKEKQAKERAERKKAKEELAVKWGVEASATLDYGAIRQHKKKINDIPRESKWVYHLMEDGIPENLSSKGDLKKKIYLANKKGLRVLLTDPARVDEVKKLNLSKLDDKVDLKNLKLSSADREKIRGHFQASSIPSFLKHFDESFLTKITPYCSEEELKAMQEMRELITHSPFVDLNSFKLLHQEEINEILEETKKVRKSFNSWLDKYSFIKCMNFQSKGWKEEVLKLLKALNPEVSKPKK